MHSSVHAPLPLVTDNATLARSDRTSSPAGPEGSARPVSFSQIFEGAAPYVWRTLRCLGVRTADLPDTCQEVFLVVHRRLPDFDSGRAALRSWIYGICLRVASAYRRRSPQLREVPEAEGYEQSSLAEQENAVERKRAREWLEEALEEVDHEDRVIFVLCELDELSMIEIAALLGCHLQTAYWRLRRARRRVESAFRARATKRR